MTTDPTGTGSHAAAVDAVTPAHKLYFAAVAGFALWVGIWGFLAPASIQMAIPWAVPPLHARFLGAMYLSGAVFMIGCMLARRWNEVRVVVPMVGIWTGALCIVSLLHLGEFDFAKRQAWVWFAAYIVFPIIAFWLAWRMRAIGGDPGGDIGGGGLPRWVGGYLPAQGVVVTLLALALLLAPVAMTTVWPWPIPPLLAQLYGAPFLAYGIGSLLLARETEWPALRIAVVAMWVFAAGVLLASLLHRALFAATDPQDWLWFGALAVATVALGAIAFVGRRANAGASTGASTGGSSGGSTGGSAGTSISAA